MRSQHGPLASAPLTALPTSKATRLEAPAVPRLLVSTFAPAPPSVHAACAVAGVLGRRGFPLEVAATQVCREAGARVSTNLHVRDMDLAELNILDGRRLEVVADGLTLWQGAQLATDAEVGGRWSIETANFLVNLAKANCFVAGPPSRGHPFGARGGA